MLNNLIITKVFYGFSRARISQDLAQVINDGLYFYEEDLWNDDESDWVSL